MDKIIVVGIDPGISGAVAIMDLQDDKIYIHDTPFIEVKKTGKTKAGKEKTAKLYSENEMARIFREYSTIPSLVHVFIENVHSMPQEGVAASFNFGMGFGIWKGIIAAYQFPRTFVTPQKWKKTIMEGIHDKDAYRVRAQQLFPKLSDQLSRKSDDGRADALLICEYGRKTLGGVYYV